MDPVAFQCRRCGNCCRHAGEVRVTEPEISSIAAFLALPESEFTSQYTRLRSDRRGLALTERDDGTCTFLDLTSFACRLHPVKPAQCRDFPFTWRYEDLERICPASARR